VVLRVSVMRRLVPWAAATKARVSVATPERPLQEIEGRPFTRQQGCGRAPIGRHARSGLGLSAVGNVGLDRDRRVEATEDRGGNVQSRHGQALASHEMGCGRGFRPDQGLRGCVPSAQIFLDRQFNEPRHGGCENAENVPWQQNSPAVTWLTTLPCTR